jgi:hypothetical protein
MIPTQALVEHLETIPGLSAVSIIRGPTSMLVPPALVIRANSPWIEPGTYCHDDQQYTAVGVVTASTPQDGEQMLYSIGLLVMDNLPDGWSFLGMDAPVLDESTGHPYLAAGIRLQYANNNLDTDLEES